MSSYINIFQKIVIAAPGISEHGKPDEFCADLKPIIRSEILEAGP